jgi:hypothetical protein
LADSLDRLGKLFILMGKNNAATSSMGGQPQDPARQPIIGHAEPSALSAAYKRISGAR